MFEGFQIQMIETFGGRIRVRTGGQGPAVLLLHGHPRTHMTWGRVADKLASFHTVICADLPGFGKSYVPPDTLDSRYSSKREKAAVLIEVMERLGHRRFCVVGHDRGSYSAFRLAMDHPEIIEKLVVIDCLPIIEHLERADWKFARDWYHWFFFAQSEKPERAILANPMAWYNQVSPELMGNEAYDDLVSALHDPSVIHGMMEDYRAGIRIDHIHEREDRDAGRKVQCPTLCLWSTRDDLEQIYGDPLAIWREWASDVDGHGIDSGHHVAEENPDDLATAILNFLT